MRIVFCNGQPKSGSTFCFELVKQLVSHRALRSDDAELREALVGNDAAQRILYVQDGDYTGYVRGSIATAATVLAMLPLPADTQLVVKTHDASPAAAPLLPVPAVVLTTFRDPFDVMAALRDQVDRELAHPVSRRRPVFLTNDTYEKALTTAAEFVARLHGSFSPSNWYCEYPAFIRPSSENLARLSVVLGVDEASVSAAVGRLDRQIRAGEVYGEFNRGEVGRGRRVINELVRTGQVPLALANDADRHYRELVGLVARHQSGIVAGDGRSG
jgi:hypothetical protein